MVVPALEILINPIIDKSERKPSKEDDDHWGLYWESHHEWREWLKNRKKKKTKSLKLKPATAGFYYENEKDWIDWHKNKDLDNHYKPRILRQHQHISHDRIHDNIDIHTGHHMLEAHVHQRATKKNVLYLAHVLKEQTGRLYSIDDKHKPHVIMDIDHGTSEEDIIKHLPRKPYSILLRYHHHHDEGFTGGSLWKQPEYIETFHQ